MSTSTNLEVVVQVNDRAQVNISHKKETKGKKKLKQLIKLHMTSNEIKQEDLEGKSTTILCNWVIPPSL